MRAAPSWRLQQIDRYVIGALAARFVPLFGGIFAILLLERSLRLVHEFSARGMDPLRLPGLVAALIPYYVNLAIPAAFALTLILVLERLVNDREIESMAAFGLSLARIVRPMLVFAALMSGVALIASGWLEPIGRHQYRMAHAAAVADSQIGRIQPRAIYSPGTELVFTADRIDRHGMERFFLSSESANGERLIATSRRASIVGAADGTSIRVALENGILLTGGAAMPRESRFAQMTLNLALSGGPKVWQRGRDAKELTLSELISRPAAAGAAGQRAYAAESWSRLGRSLSVVLLPLLVAPLLLRSREHRALTLAGAGLLMIAAHHLLNLATNLARSSSFGPVLPIAGVWALLLIAALAIWIACRRAPGPSSRRATGWGPFRFTLDARLGRLLPLGSQIGRYFRSMLLTWTLAALAATTAILLLVDAIEHGDALVERGDPLLALLRFVALRAPATGLQALPIAALAGAILTFLAIRASREIMAMQIASLPIFRIVRMGMAVPTLLALLWALLAEWAVPASQARFAEWWHQPAAGIAAAPDARWFRIGDTIVRAAGEPGRHDTLRSVEIYARDSDGMLAQQVLGLAARWQENAWVFPTATRLTLAGDLTTQAVTDLRWSTLTPAMARKILTAAPELSAQDARRALDGALPTDRARAFYDVRWHWAFAGPFVPALLLLLAAPVALASQNPASTRRGIWQAVVAGLAFLIVDGCFRIFGQLGMTSVTTAVWAAPLLFVLVGLIPLLRGERGYGWTKPAAR